jgi:hypothetical protein
VAKFKYLETRLKNQNCNLEEIKSTLNEENACYRSVHSLLSSHPLCKNLKVEVNESIILPVVLPGCETWYVTLSEKHRF